MPLYEYNCPTCGQKKTVVQKMSAQVAPECCDAAMRKDYRTGGFIGGDYLDSGLKGKFSKQAGVHFKNSKEVDAWAAARGLAVVSSTSSEWKAIKLENKEEAQKDARKAGFADQEARKRYLKENQRDAVAAAAEKKIDAYHAEHGSEGRQAVEEFATLPEKKPTVTVAG